MISRFSFSAATTVLASFLALTCACSDVIDVPTPTDEGGDVDDDDHDGIGDGDGGDGDDEGPGGEGECPSMRVLEGVCQPDVPLLSVEADCDDGIQDGQCKPAAPERGTAADCPGGIRDGLCDPAPPAFSNWTCNYGGALPGLHTASDSTLGVEGVSSFTACRAAWAEGCGTDTMPKFGVGTCQPVSRTCPADWPSEAVIRASVLIEGSPSDGTILYASQAGSAAPDGLTPQTAFTLDAALAAATEGDIIALSVGNYSVASPLALEGVAIVGACAAGTRLSPSSASEATPLLALGSGARISHVTLTGNRPALTSSGNARLANVQIVNALGNGVTVTGGELNLENVLITGTRANGAGTAGSGLAVIGGNANLSFVSLVGNRGAAITVDGANSGVAGTDVLVLDTLAAPSGAPGQGAAVGSGGYLGLERAALSGNRDAGVLASGAGSQVELTDTYIASTVAVGGGLSGAALYGSAGVAVTVTRLFAEDNALGLRISGAESALGVDEAIIADPSEPAGNAGAEAGSGVLGEGGPGITIDRLALLRNRAGVLTSGGSLQLDNTVISGSSGQALQAAGSDLTLNQLTLADNAGGLRVSGDGTLEVTDVRIVDTRKAGAADAHALFIDSASGNLERVLLARNAEYGVFVSGQRPDLNFTDLRVSDTRSVEVGGSAARGIGLVVTDPAGAPNIGVVRGRIEQSREYGVLVDGPGPQLFLTDVSVLGTEGAGGRAGAIVFVNDAPATQAAGGLVQLERVLVDDNVHSGVSVRGPGIELDLNDVVISDTGALSGGAAGAGLSVAGGAVLSGQRVALSNNARAGVVAEGAGTELDLTDLIVNDTQPISAASGEGLKVVGATASIVNATLLRNASAGIWAAQGASVELSDVKLEDTLAPTGGSGVGIDVIGATLDGERLSLNKSHGLGLSASLGAQVTLTDLEISQISAASIRGRGVEISSGSNVTLNRTLIAGSPDYAVLVSGPDAKTPELVSRFASGAALPERTTLNLYDLSVRDVGGGGVAVLPGSSVELDTFDIRSSALVGLQLVGNAAVKASGGRITANPVGVNVQGGDIDLASVLENVAVTANQVDRGTQELPVPELSDVASRSGDRL